MFKKTVFFICIFAVFTVSLLVLFSKTSVQALDDDSYYGDGCSVNWDDVSEYLSVLYKNTPYISVSNGSEIQTFDFNIELFMDMGLYVYGDPVSVQFSGTVNDFKEADYGYFLAENESNTVTGEYRYLGYSIDGIPMTNTRFPNEIYTNMAEMTLMKYSDLPEYLQEIYSVKGLNNDAYSTIRELIESPDSPIWDFININNGEEVTLRERLTGFGLMEDGVPLVDILDYGILYSWAESGGIIRVFYQSKVAPDSIRYATFSGPVSVEFARKLPGLTAKLIIPYQSAWHSTNTLFCDLESGSLFANIMIESTLNDNYGELSDFDKKYTYTRDDVRNFNLLIDGRTPDAISSLSKTNDLITSGLIFNYEIPVSSLVPGYNAIRINGKATVRFDNYYIAADTGIYLIVIYEPPGYSTPTAIPQTTASPETTDAPETTGTPNATATYETTVTPEASTAPEMTTTPVAATIPNLTPAITPTPRITVNRKW